ncbi:MAG TPA: NfeD family protein [Anaerolineales bacterium]|nr:NfeD family protein [Anaerolineales bacterium]
MDFLLDPNIAYLFLLGGVALAMMALVTPGTGFFEIGALFCIALAGYAIYNLSFNWWALLLVGLSLIPFIYTLQKPKREPFLVLSLLLLAVGSIFIFPRTEEQAFVNPLVAIVGSALITGFAWLALRKSLEAAHARPSHSLEGLVGQIGEAKTRVFEEGSVQVDGELWSARSETSIPAGSSVRVVRREGFVLIVEKSG